MQGNQTKGKGCAMDLISREEILKLPQRKGYAINGYESYIRVSDIKHLPSAQPEITDEQAIEHLQSTGWMQNHDREMYESGLREQLADDSGSYDSLVPCEDAISRQAAIEALAEQMPTPYTPDGSHPADDGIFAAQEIYADCIETIKLLPSAQPEIIYCEECKYRKDNRWALS